MVIPPRPARQVLLLGLRRSAAMASKVMHLGGSIRGKDDGLSIVINSVSR